MWDGSYYKYDVMNVDKLKHKHFFQHEFIMVHNLGIKQNISRIGR